MRRQDGRAQQSALDHLAHTARVLTGRPIDVGAKGQFFRYLELLLVWNRTQNLSGFESPSDIVRGLFEDSLLFLPLLPLFLLLKAKYYLFQPTSYPTVSP